MDGDIPGQEVVCVGTLRKHPLPRASPVSTQSKIKRWFSVLRYCWPPLAGFPSLFMNYVKKSGVLTLPRDHFVRQWATLLLLIHILIPVTLSPPYTPAIRSDGVGYHMWIRAILEARDLSFCKWGHLSGMLFSSTDLSRGICRNVYPPGLALLQFPIMAPLVNLRPEAPLISPEEHLASLLLGAIVLALVCWLMMASSYLLGVPVWATNFAVLVYIFGTGLFHYGTYDSSFTHIYSALGFSLIVWLWLRNESKGQPTPAWVFSSICFFLVAIRNTNVIPILFLLPLVSFPKSRPAWRVGLAGLVGIAMAVSMQVAYNYYATRQITFSTYGQFTFHFDQPMQGSVLFSYERGLFTYYPVMIVGLIAGVLVRRTRRATYWLLGLIATFVIVYGFWIELVSGGWHGPSGICGACAVHCCHICSRNAARIDS